MSDYFRSKLKSLAKSKRLAITYSCPVIANGSLLPSSMAVAPGTKCYLVSLSIGDDMFHGFGPTPFIAKSSAEYEAYTVLCSDGSVMKRIEYTLNKSRVADSELSSVSPVEVSPALSQTSNYQFSQVYESPSIVEEKNVDEFQLYLLSDSDEDVPNNDQTAGNVGHHDNSITDTPVNTVFYTVPKTRDELMSVFCNMDSVSSDYIEEDEGLMDRISPQSKDNLFHMATNRGLHASVKDGYCRVTNEYVAKATAGFYQVIETNEKRAIAKRTASLKLMNMLKSLPEVGEIGSNHHHLVSPPEKFRQELHSFDTSRYQLPEVPPPVQLSLPCQQPLYSDNFTREPPNMNDNSLMIFNPVGYLQEIAMTKKRPLPVYTTVSKEHVNGYTTFECTVQAMEITATGCGLNKKHARRKAAHNCITLLSKTKGDLRYEVQSLDLSQIPFDVVGENSDIGKLKNITA